MSKKSAITLPAVFVTKRDVEALRKRCEAGVRVILPDGNGRRGQGGESGLRLVADAHSLSWRLRYRLRGRDGLGKRPNVTSVKLKAAPDNPAEARREAQRLKQTVHEGRDPAREKRQRIEKAILDRRDTVDAAVGRYAEYLPRRQRLRGDPGGLKPRVAREEFAHLKRAIESAGLGVRPIASLDKADVARVLAACLDQPNVARHRFGALNRFLDWTLDEGLVAANPCLLIAKAKRPKTGGRRDRVLQLAELATLWKAAEGLPHDVWRDYARTVFALPARRNEVAAMDWRDLNLDGAMWVLPNRITKNNDEHSLHLHPLVFELLKARHLAAGKPASGLVFPSPRPPHGQLTAFSALKRAIDQLAPDVPAWTWHDTRRGFASTLGEHGAAEPVVDAVLNHRMSVSRPGVVGVYQRSRRWPEQVEAMKLWGRLLEAAISGEPAPTGNVVVLRA
jgi:integrase